MRELFFRTYGEPTSLHPPLLILHGLFGSSKNWISAAKALSQDFFVVTLDLRNHGDSFHDAEHSIPAMASDVLVTIQAQGWKKPNLIGHSMGGLVAMYLDLMNPNTLHKLLIEDIAPRTYPFIYDKEIAAMLLDLSDCKSRSEIEEKVKTLVPDAFVRQFLLMNLDRTDEGTYFWKLNVRSLQKADRLFENHFPVGRFSETPTKFVFGGASEYTNDKDISLVQTYFPKSSLEIIPDGDHFMHFTKSSDFLKITRDFFV